MIAGAYRLGTCWLIDKKKLAAAIGGVVALLLGLAVRREARRREIETPILRFIWILLMGSAICDAIFSPARILSLVWTLSIIFAASSYVLFNAGARRYSSKKMMINQTPRDYEALDDEDTPEDEETPEDAAGPLSTIVFAWLSPLLALGYKQPLETNDLYPLTKDDDPDSLKRALREATQREIQNGKKPDKALLFGLIRAFGFHWYIGCFFKFIYDTCQLSMPLLLSALLKVLAHRDLTKEAYCICTAIVATAILSTAVLHQYFQRTYRTGMRLKAAATALIFDKALVARHLDEKEEKSHEKDTEEKKDADTSQKENQKSSTVQNLMSVDAQRLQDNMTYLATIGSGIYQIVVCLYLLFAQLRYAAFGGTFVMLIFLPVTQRVILASRKFQSRVLVHKDARIKLQSEALSGMKIIKLYAYEEPLSKQLKKLRTAELEALWKYKIVAVLSRIVYAVVPTAVSLSTFAMYTLLGGKLTVSRVYTSLALFNILRFPLMMVPRAIGSAVEAMLSIERIGNYLASDEVLPICQPPNTANAVPNGRIIALNADIDWPAHGGSTPKTKKNHSHDEQQHNPLLVEMHSDRALLRNLNFDLGPGTLTICCGETGTGKTGLVLSLLGETSIIQGSLALRGSVAYAAQTAWIRNATLRENILFGAAFNAEKYNQVIYRCALEQDIAELADGDATEIGEKGLTLSGGQKQRCALARALYADADVYILDDVLSAVDAHVAAHLFAHYISYLRDQGKVVLLVTHNLSTLRKSDNVLCLSPHGHRVDYYGPPEGFIRLGQTHPDDYPLAALAAKKLNSTSNLVTLESAPTEKTNSFKEPSNKNGQEESQRGLMSREARGKGGVSKRVRLAYLAAAGGLGAAACVVVCQVIYQVASVVASWWLGYWSAKPKLGTALGLEIYSFLSIAAVILSCISYYVMSMLGQRAARKMHDDLLDALLLAPMRFFDSTPVGRLVNLFSKDLYTIDEELPITLAMWLTVGAIVVSTLATISYVTPLFLVAAVPLLWLYLGTNRYFIPTVRELKRLDATSRSPIFSSFAEVLDGATTIRAFRAETRFEFELSARLRTNLTAYFLGTACNRWLAVRLEALGTAITGAAAFLAVATHTKPYLAGLSLTYALSVTQALNWLIRMNADLENNSVAVERIVDYTATPPEVDAQSAIDLPQLWPSAGAIKIQNLELRYRPELPLVLKGLNFEIAPGTKAALCGRTGSGKSSFLLALLRIAPPLPTSKILVDGIDLATVSLTELRSRISMIPQDAVLFSGSVRFNIDPFDMATDQTRLIAIRDACLEDRLNARAQGGINPLDLPVEEGGKNFSIGEAQLLCLARAVLRASKLVTLDEATSAIDDALDNQIQNTIRTKFKDSTVIAIAHRLNTILDYDRVLVLDAGNIVEDGNPRELASDPTSRFGMMAAAHEQGALSSL
eukprot:CAMPEP_0197308826 /NCGR_PEP_ID=MMETSP0891-20130614/7350_1 /TAXON_ID=44058 ORGANISM="Aureoumbra lagunensis, Strain CCMP1510" /NCGR_SAMPLE_ID=MMETSP0891 /ASSEMBLY_ACC=CAM_ASM_000534 /LENGTH=1424 /DNA_ID=CAMNT_0042793557 /DNA_START=180 /DNA_END=4454 /DNA_ORIENTATION=+